MIKIITISGLDGSGKSTQIKKLEKCLAAQGYQTAYCHTVQFALINRLWLLWKKNKPKKSVSPAKQPNLPANTSGNAIAILLRKIMLPVDLYRFRRLLNKLEKQGVDFLLSDRYFYDQLINLLYLRRKKQLSFYCQQIVKLIPPPTHAFFLQTAPKIINRRQRNIEQGQQYLAEKNRLYQEKWPWRWQKINGEQDPNAVFQEIKAVLQQDNYC